MSTHKAIDRICVFAMVLALLITMVFLNGQAFGIEAAETVMGYESRLFDTGRVHTLDIVMDDWDSFVATCENEEYALCAVVIDGEAYQNVGIRAKGNTSLSSVSVMNSDRYSFKVEFDQYDSTQTYHGLDKLSLNNLIQDTTYMKDYLTYRLMGSFGVAAPLCSFVQITVNGADWGLYLAVEGVEESFLQRNYGADYGELYKPDSLSFGGGRGNGKDFDMSQFTDSMQTDEGSRPSGGMPDFGDMSAMGERFGFGQMPDSAREADSGRRLDMGGMFDFGGMGSGDVKLQYIDDDPDSYGNIFDSAKTDITDADQNRLIRALKTLSESDDPAAAVDVDQVLRYFVVHNFVVNGDSYTGSMIHNYYLYEEDGLLSMIPWDYNLAYGTFQGGSANSAVNDPIDTPLSVTGSGDRPIADWIFQSEEATAPYHQYFTEFLEQTDFAALIDETAALIAPYVAQDPTAFYGYEDFAAGVETLRSFCLLREESVLGQLAGSIPATDEGQSADDSALIDASGLNLSDMGSMGGGMPDMSQFGGMQPPEGFDASQFEGMQPPEGFGGSQFEDMQSPDGFDFSQFWGTQSDSTADSTETTGNTGSAPGGRTPSMGDFSMGGSFSGSMGRQNMTQWILLAASVLILLAGLLFAAKFRR